jgi:branched-chain amino acid transport system substrate-binding protein
LGGTMERRRMGRVTVAVGAALAVVASFGLTQAAGAASSDQGSDFGKPTGQFKNLKHMAEPKNCDSPDPGVSNDEIKIGSIVTTSGTLGATYSGILDGIKARFAKANAENELGKRKLTLVNEDDGADTARNVTAAQQLIESDKVFAVLGDSTADDASGPYLNQQGIPVVGWQAGLPVWGTYTNYFGFQNSNVKDIKTHYVARPAEAAKALGAKKMVVIGNSFGASAVFAQQVADAAKQIGLKVPYQTTDIPVGNTEWGGVIDKIKSTGANALYTSMGTTDAISLVNALKQQNVKLDIVVFPGGYDPRVLSLPAFDGVYFSLEFKPFEVNPPAPGQVEFKKWMQQTGATAPIGQISSVGWLSANAMIEGIKAAGVDCPTRKAFINNLRLVKNYTADGWFPPLNFSDTFNRPFFCAYYIQVVNQQFVPQFGGKQFCGKVEIRNNKILKTLPTTTVAPPTTSTPQ